MWDEREQGEPGVWSLSLSYVSVIFVCVFPIVPCCYGQVSGVKVWLAKKMSGIKILWERWKKKNKQSVIVLISVYSLKPIYHFFPPGFKDYITLRELSYQWSSLLLQNWYHGIRSKVLWYFIWVPSPTIYEELLRRSSVINTVFFEIWNEKMCYIILKPYYPSPVYI